VRFRPAAEAILACLEEQPDSQGAAATRGPHLFEPGDRRLRRRRLIVT
jgi:hypothetical protein